MAEVLVEYSDVVISAGTSRYVARACGTAVASGRWQGWLEFIDVDTGDAVRSPRETTQPNRTDTIYWATGLTPVYLEGALQRALHPTFRARAAPTGDAGVRRACSRSTARTPGPRQHPQPVLRVPQRRGAAAPSARRLLGVAPGQHRSRLSVERSARGHAERHARRRSRRADCGRGPGTQRGSGRPLTLGYGAPVRRRSSSTMSIGSHGLGMKTSHPAACAASRSAGITHADTMITAM